MAEDWERFVHGQPRTFHYPLRWSSIKYQAWQGPENLAAAYVKRQQRQREV